MGAAMLKAFELNENASKIKKARESAGNDMLKLMQIVFPITTQIQMDVVKNYGFSGDGEGVIQFASAVKSMSTQDAELAERNAALRSFIIPQMGAPPPTLTAPSQPTVASAS